MPQRTPSKKFQHSLLALAISMAFSPTWALDLANSPPGTVESYVAPNVILSLDDSTSMNARDMVKVNGKWTKTRTETLADALKETFSDTTLISNGKIRLAWQSMGNCTTVRGLSFGNLGTDAAQNNTYKNMMRIWDDTHRKNFLAYANAYKACTNTPTHDMVQRADQYMRAGLHKNGPWADKPGEKLADARNDNKPLGCRRNYHILLTDGGWNGTEQQTSPRNYDNRTTPNLPNGQPYTATAQTRLYRDSEDYTTIADWAFKSWADPLQPPTNLSGKVSPLPEYDKAPATETIINRSSKKTATLEKFWNPKYDPADWAHMVTFTIGFSSDALPKKNYDASGSDKGAIVAPTSLLPYGDDGNLADYANGTYTWRAYKNDRGHDMWHAALNGRGRFYAVEQGEDLKKAFEQIIRTINTNTDPETTSTATSGSNISRNDVAKFTSNYEPQNAWKGFITAEKIKTDGTTESAWGGKNTAEKLDNRTAARVVLSWNEVSKKGISFQWNNLSTAQKLSLQKNNEGIDQGVNTGKDRLNYILGNRSKEGTDAPGGYTPENPYRKRDSIQGDIVNSTVWYTSTPVSNYAFKGYGDFIKNQKNRTPMIYVGGNDGMLHGFSANDGEELIAYIPKGIIPKLTQLTDPTYNKQHRYFVDGSPMTGDVDINNTPNSDDSITHTPDWRTLLVGSLGAGGKGYFLLDVTSPSGFNNDTPSQLVKLDRTRSSEAGSIDCASLTDTEKTICEQDKDIGHITAEPVRHSNNILQTTQITFMNDNRWAVIMGNGYNSENQRPALLIQYLDGQQELKIIPATTDVKNSGNATDNGLSAPRLVDINSDGRVDIAYAGDNLGNLWKFDLTSYSNSDWTVAFNGHPLFTAQGPATYGDANHDNLAQSITVAPTIRPNDRKMEVGTGNNKHIVSVGGMMVAFGTGRNVGQEDPENRAVQTLYGVLDNTRYKYRTDNPKRLEIHTGNTCEITDFSGCTHIPAPKPLGKGSVLAKLSKLKFEAINGTDASTTVATDPLTPANWNEKNGWYIDLPETRERLLKNMEFYDGSNILVAYSQVPAKGSLIDEGIESCEVGSVDEESQYRTFLNIMDGSTPSIQLMTIVGNFDKILSRKKVSKGAHQIITKDNDENYDIDTKNEKEGLNRMPETTSRPSWRQMQ